MGMLLHPPPSPSPPPLPGRPLATSLASFQPLFVSHTHTHSHMSLQAMSSPLRFLSLRQWDTACGTRHTCHHGQVGVEVGVAMQSANVLFHVPSFPLPLLLPAFTHASPSPSLPG